MKKQYIMPKIEEIEIDVCEMLALSMQINTESGYYEEDFARARRGTWGNLWDEGN